MIFKDRTAAGRQLAAVLTRLPIIHAIVYGLPRGGVVCAREVARALSAPLSLIITRKIGHPTDPEYAIGAVAEDGCVELAAEGRLVDSEWLKNKIEAEQREAKRRRERYLHGAYPLSATNKTAIIVDDGLATGLTMRAAIAEVQHMHPQKIIVAIPVASAGTIRHMNKLVDEIIALHAPEDFYAVGAYYKLFEPVTDNEVVALLK